MAERFLETYFTPHVLDAQRHYFGRSQAIPSRTGSDPLTEEERVFVEARDSFYMATVSENGWPYMQHRGGAPGFLRVVSPNQLGFADYRGNRQMLSTGNLAANDRVALFLMDYARRERLKILGHARVMDAREHPELIAQFSTPETRNLVERVFLIDVLSFDWNCPKYITPRFTADELQSVVAPLQARITELEAQLRAQS